MGKESLLLLIAGPGSGGLFSRPIPIFSKHCSVIAFDNRGAGTNRPSPDMPYTIEMMADDAAGLLRVLDIEQDSTCSVSRWEAESR